MDLGKIVKLVILLAVVWFAWTRGRPWIEEHVKSGTDSRDSSSSEGSRCVALALDASDTFGGGVATYASPPYDLGAWSGFRGDVESRLSTALSACFCGQDSCRKATEAMRLLRGLVSRFDQGVRGGGVAGNPARTQQEIDSLLAEARNLAERGS